MDQVKVMTRCPSCKGKKRLLGNGNMYRDCTTCQAIGYIKEELKQVTTSKPVIDDIHAPKDKPKPRMKAFKANELKPFSTNDNVLVNSEKTH